MHFSVQGERWRVYSHSGGARTGYTPSPVWRMGLSQSTGQIGLSNDHDDVVGDFKAGAKA